MAASKVLSLKEISFAIGKQCVVIMHTMLIQIIRTKPTKFETSNAIFLKWGKVRQKMKRTKIA